MPLRTARLGSPRHEGEGLRIGTVRRPPRGVPKEEFASRDFYDVWLPELSPSADLVRQALAAQADQDGKAWSAFERAFRKELATPEARHLIDLVVAMSSRSPVSIGCYCEDEQWCHRTVLRSAFEAAGAEVVSS